MNYWLYKDDYITSTSMMPEGTIGYTYLITSPDNRIYVGKKVLTHKSRKKISAKEKKETQTRKVFKVVEKDSGWLDYWGSSKPLLADLAVSDKSRWKREILDFACSKSQLSYLEVRSQFLFNVLENDSYNLNILGRFFTKTVQPCK